MVAATTIGKRALPCEAEVVEKKARVDIDEAAASGVANAKDQSADVNLIKNYRVSKVSRKALAARGIVSFFPIQSATYDAIYDGKHVIGRARTGTGKTLAFSLPSLERLMTEKQLGENSGGRNRAMTRLLAVLPTRELAQQVAREIQTFAADRFGVASIVGGLPDMEQLPPLRLKGHVVVGTPGRLLDYLRRGELNPEHVKVMVLDEADQMLEMGFKEDVDAILQFVTGAASGEAEASPSLLGQKVQLLLFTATLPSWVKKVADEYMQCREKQVVDIVGAAGETNITAGGISHLCVQCNWANRKGAILPMIRRYAGVDGKVIIFTETKNQANEIACESPIKHLSRALHGDIPQKTREQTLAAFKSGAFQCLVATDVAARGLHIDDINLVVQLQPPKDVDTFVHRSGRTGRAGQTGTNIVFFGLSDIGFIKTIESKTGVRFRRIGIPQAADLLVANAQQLVAQLLSAAQHPITSTQRSLVAPVADELVAGLGGDTAEALRHLLVHLAVDNSKGGSAGSASPSLLSGREGWKTFELRVSPDDGQQLPHKGVFFRLLREALKAHKMDEQLASNVFSSMLRADGFGAVFEATGDYAAKFEALAEACAAKPAANRGITVSVAAELPDIIDPAMENEEGNGSGGGRNPNTCNRRGGAGSRGGGGPGRGGGFNRGGGRGGAGFGRGGGRY